MFYGPLSDGQVNEVRAIEIFSAGEDFQHSVSLKTKESEAPRSIDRMKAMLARILQAISPIRFVEWQQDLIKLTQWNVSLFLI